ncbi:MAG: hypothetical protein IGS38_09860 [Synechococcales cyanobacterium M58_A2018_015]|nr:hypothetical protein [Synechococcales cyanobacterium M58_A2018_015]
MNRCLLVQLLALPVLFGSTLHACGLQRTSPSASHSIASNSESASGVSVAMSSQEEVSLDTFSPEELFQQGSGGCGMSLWRAGDDPRTDGMLFFNGLETGSNTTQATALIKLDGEFVRLQRTRASGEAFYGQAPVQIFRDASGEIQVEVMVKRGAAGEIESVGISKGLLRVKQLQHLVETAVVGDAGC